MRTALITGATSGIGEEFATVLAARGYRLILTGRRVDRLTALANRLPVPTRLIPADLSTEAGCYELLEELRDEKIFLFINNAGFGKAGHFVDIDLKDEIEMVKVNDIAQHILFKSILQKMVKRDRGIILNVASSAGLLPGGPYMSTYYASKAYMASLTRGVAEELREMGSNVYVCALCPGPVNTEFNAVANVSFSLPGISVETCVREAILGMNRHQTIIVPTAIMRLAIFGQKLLPTRLAVKLCGHQQKKKLGE